MNESSKMEGTGRTEVSALGEFGLIQHLTRNFELTNRDSLKGPGDDAAVIKTGQDEVMVVTTDLLLEGIHFDLSYYPLRHLGYKSIIVNLSDIYAMNALPAQVTVSIGISNRFSVEALDELYEGIHMACDRYMVDLVGGDTSASIKGLIISVTALGKAKESNIVYRNTAQAGDTIFVSGDMGAAYLGLQLLEREKRIYKENPSVQPDLEGEKYLVGRQLMPEARVDIIEMLEELKIKPTAMIDVSDGLSSDLMHICRSSHVGCRVYEDRIPLSEEAIRRAVTFNMAPVSAALNGGEDYELLFTVAPENVDRLSSNPLVTAIGEITLPNQGWRLMGKSGQSYELHSMGWDSFREGDQ